MRSTRLLVAAVAVVYLIPLEALAAQVPDLPDYGEGFRALYEYAISNTLPDLEHPGNQSPETGSSTIASGKQPSLGDTSCNPSLLVSW